MLLNFSYIVKCGFAKYKHGGSQIIKPGAELIPKDN